MEFLPAENVYQPHYQTIIGEDQVQIYEELHQRFSVEPDGDATKWRHYLTSHLNLDGTVFVQGLHDFAETLNLANLSHFAVR